MKKIVFTFIALLISINIAFANDIKRLTEAANNGEAQAQYELGILYDTGQDVPQDAFTAGQWWEKAAAQGHVEAQRLLGIMYYMGTGVPKDEAKAEKWFQKAAEQGDMLAQSGLVNIYEQRGMSKNYIDAAYQHWDMKAAEQGSAYSQYKMGLRYALGNGVPKNYKLAYMWYSLSLAHTSDAKIAKDIRECLEEIEFSMTKEQIAQAQDMALEWLKKH